MKGHMLCDPIYGKCPEQASPQRQKAEEWLPGAGGGAWGDGCYWGLGHLLG